MSRAIQVTLSRSLGRRNIVRPAIGAFIGYLILSLIYTWPLVLRLDTTVVQRTVTPIDTGQNIWNLWWVSSSLLSWHNPFFTRYLFFPEALTLFWQTLGLPNALLVFPILVFFGPIAAYNVVVILSFVVSGFLTFILVKRILRDNAAAFISGLIFAFAPYHAQPVLSGSLEIAAVYWIPLYLLSLVRLFERPTAVRAVLSAAALWLTMLSSHYYGLFCAVLTVLYLGLVCLRTEGWWARQRLVTYTAAVIILWIGLLLPLIWPLDQLPDVVLEDWRARQIFHSAELIDFLVPNVLHPVWGSWSAALMERIHPAGFEAGASVGLVVWVLLFAAVRRYRQARSPWLVLTMVFAVLALGPELMVAGKPTGIPLPFSILDLVSPFRNSSRPIRMLPVMMAPLSVVAGYGVCAILKRYPARRRLIATALAGTILFEYAVQPWPLSQLTVDPLYTSLNRDPQPGAVLELPPRSDDSMYMLNQLCHGRPLAGGYLARTPEYPLSVRASAVRQLWNEQPPSSDIVAYDAAAELATLGIRFVVLHLPEIRDSHLAYLHDILATPGISLYRVTDTLEIYAVDLRAARAVILPVSGWFEPETDGRRTWRWIGSMATVDLETPSEQAMTLSFIAEAYEEPRRLRVEIDQRLHSDFSIPAGSGQLISLSFVAPAGTRRMVLRSTTARSPEGRELSISISDIQLRTTELAPAAGVANIPPVIPSAARPPCPGAGG